MSPPLPWRLPRERARSPVLVALGALVAFAAASCGPASDVPYGACQASAVCSPDTPRCITFTNNVNNRSVPLCTVACNVDADCPDRGICITAQDENRSRFCMQRCLQPADCRFPNAICPLLRGGVGACVP